MESRFASLRQRDASVSMLRVKMSRRRSQTQKENRQRTINTRRQLEKLQELEMSSLDASMARSNMSTLQEREANIKPEKIKAQEERLKQLERWKERKALEREKEKREKQQKGVFKTGLYHPKDVFTGAAAPPASAKLKERKVNVAPTQSTRVTRSMKQQEVQQIQNPVAALSKVKPDPGSRPNRLRAAPVKAAPSATKSKVCNVSDRVTTAGPAVQSLPGRSARRPPVPKAPAGKDKLTEKVADVRTTRDRTALAPSSGQKEAAKLLSDPIHPTPSEDPEPNEEKVPSPPKQTACAEEEDMQVEEAPPPPPSFAPKDFIFQAPLGLSSFKFEPLTPRSADAFLTPSPTLNLPPVPPFTLDPPAEPSKPSPPRPAPAASAPSPCSPLESKHDVPYFRSEIAKETERLTTCCHDWESKVEDESIPEEMRDRMRTAVGQARLLMKERFKQFSGLVDDCELGRGEKVTTCTDLQGFWDMVYYQVKDVNKKFDALKEAERRSWVEECKPPPRQRKVVKKPSAAPPKPTGTNAAAKSRLAAIKAAMRAKQQAAEAEKASQDAASDGLPAEKADPPTEALKSETVVFDGGFFKVESPAKSSIRRSGHVSAAVPPQASPRYITPKRATRRSLALERTPVGSGVQLSRSALKQTPASRCQEETNASLCFSPVMEVPSIEERSPAQKAGSVSPPTISVEVNSAEPAGPFGLSPCAGPASPAVQVPAETPNSSVVEDVPGLDFERYLQPSQRCSLSPREPIAEEILSPMVTDVEMESPIGRAEESLCHQAPALSAGSSVFSPQSPQVQSAKAALLLFTPDLKDRIRQSVCPTDLMCFTPPSNI
ncbi:disks large-associated protein 5 isoform X1 [Oryzias melastigma]|uniref:disks large-associated protein 5 isoform X1 n=1 Tax=Oryzias melastigma TaxID=30732 RepID=UPI000CF80416|nr:disks large-associated protein 5 isoform X1 [Oryzias melastigma]